MLRDDENQLEQQFQSAQNNVEYLKFHSTNQPESMSSLKQKSRKTVKESVNLKFQKINNRDGKNMNGKNYKSMGKNISFQSDKSLERNDYRYQNQYDDGRSSLGYYYQNHQHAQLVYRKTRNLGTQWIGQRQYYTSLFATPQLIQKLKKKCLFGNFKQNQQHQPAQNIYNQHLDKNVTNSAISFDSDFESGNLFAVYKVGILQYDLLLQNDVNTKGNTQWFYFRIKNPPPNKNIKINIVNFRKSDSLFNYGMLPCFHSSQNEKRNNEGWVRKGSKIKYFRNNHQIQNARRSYFTLTFTIMTQFPNDTVKIAQCYPYTVSDLHNFLGQIRKINYKKDLCHTTTILNKTLGGNKIEQLVIKQANSKIKNNQNRPLIILIARQHPGQTPGSFMIQGLIQYCLSRDKDSQFLRKNYEIRVIPMVNPDGVYVGNYRTNLYGVDLNRKWDCSTKQKQFSKSDKQNKANMQAHQIIHIKKHLASIAKGRQIAYILDFHGHSRKLYSFFYGNSCSQSPSDIKAFPYICSKLTSMIRYEDCTFNVEQQKRATARIQFLMNYKTLNIFTFEASFFGYMSKNKQKKHFTIQNYKNLGMIIGKAIYLCEKRREESQIQTKQKILYQKWFKELTTDNVLIKAGDVEDSGSQSCPDQCEIFEDEKTFLYQQLSYQQQQSKRLTSTSSKTRQKFRHDNLVSAKQPQKSLRQMQVLDIARVNSIFPNDVLALVPNTFYLKSAKNIKKQTKNAQIQTQPCPIIKVYESCKGTQHSQLVSNFNEKPSEIKSVMFERSKAKSVGDAFSNYSGMQTQLTAFQSTLKNFAALSVPKSKSIHQKQLFQNARHLNALKKSSDVRRHFKKVLTEHQLSKRSPQMIKNDTTIKIAKFHKIVQTIISFHKQNIVRYNQNEKHHKLGHYRIEDNYKKQQQRQNNEQYCDDFIERQRLCQSKMFDSPQKISQQSKQQIIQNSHNFWTIESRRKSIGLQTRQLSTAGTKNKFRKTMINTKNIIRNHSNDIYQCDKLNKNQKLMQNWRIKKKSLI